MNHGDRRSREQYHKAAGEIEDEIDRMLDQLDVPATVIETTKKTDTERSGRAVVVDGTMESWKVQTADAEWVLEKRTGSLRTDE